MIVLLNHKVFLVVLLVVLLVFSSLYFHVNNNYQAKQFFSPVFEAQKQSYSKASFLAGKEQQSEGTDNGVETFTEVDEEGNVIIKTSIKPDEGPGYVPGEMIVKFKTNPSFSISSTGGEFRVNSVIASVDELNEKFSVSSYEKLVEIGSGIFLLKMEQSAEATTAEKQGETMFAISEYSESPSVEYAEPNYIRYIDKTPNDPLYPLMWSLNNTGQDYPNNGKYGLPPGTPDADMDAPEAWDIETGSNEIIVAVLDTGVDYTHRDIKENMWINKAEYNGKPGVDDERNGYVDDIYGYNFYNNKPNPIDFGGHGTHVAGTIAAVGNNGTDITGVAWNVRIMALKICYIESCIDSKAIKALDYAAKNGARIASNSWGGSYYSQALQDAVKNTVSQGVVIIAAAGNTRERGKHYPSSLDNVISVAALDSKDKKAGFSTYDETVDISAPGVDILSLRAKNTSMGTINDNYTTVASGTSMATPNVSGVIALILSKNPGLSPAEVEEIIESTADNIDALNPYYKGFLGAGRINAFKALSQMSELQCPTGQKREKEICDGKDNDCDGKADDGMPIVTCGTGACRRIVSTCNSGKLEICVPWQPIMEICGNKFDEDCDGIIDNGCPLLIKLFKKIFPQNAKFSGYSKEIVSFGASVASLGDLDKDGIGDIAVGANTEQVLYWDESTMLGKLLDGSVWTLLLNRDGTVKKYHLIEPIQKSPLSSIMFGNSIGSGDIDKDGITDILVGSPICVMEDYSSFCEAYEKVTVLFLNSDGTVKNQKDILKPFSTVPENVEKRSGDSLEKFGASVAYLGDIAGDGTTAIAVGSTDAYNKGEIFYPWHKGRPYKYTDWGAVWIIFLDKDGVVKKYNRIGNNRQIFISKAGSLGDIDGTLIISFGSSVASLGDLDGDGINDIVVGAKDSSFDRFSFPDIKKNQGAILVLFLNRDGTVKKHQIIAINEGGFSEKLVNYERFGSSVASLGDLDGDGVTDIAVGADAYYTHFEDPQPGSVYILFMNKSGTVKSHKKISSFENFLSELDILDYFGSSIANLGDFDNDGAVDIAVGAVGDDKGNAQDGGAIWLLSLNKSGDPVKPECKPNETRECSTGELGVCSAGTQTCSGGEWGDCIRKTNPVKEICSNNLDDDCDGKTDNGDEDCPKETCVDSDNGKDYYAKGSVSGQQSISIASKKILYSMDDYCIGNTLAEFYCEASKPKKEDFRCSRACRGGKCVPS